MANQTLEVAASLCPPAIFVIHYHIYDQIPGPLHKQMHLYSFIFVSATLVSLVHPCLYFYLGFFLYLRIVSRLL